MDGGSEGHPRARRKGVLVLARIREAVLRCALRPVTGCSFVASGDTARYYLSQLEEWGYTLSDVQRIITDHRTEAQAERGEASDE
ncbi:hypothetical protein [Arthrobacter yangruifuii]|uniref:hypothetical protein n=1 Tax=Arthrobacter yangruifuii TaxID=2606616 RepID=UPI0011B73261|nr:hypothetical protein [Arthrobacter yangruifuii]